MSGTQQHGFREAVSQLIKPFSLKDIIFPEVSLLHNFSSLIKQGGNYYWQIQLLRGCSLSGLWDIGEFLHPSPRELGCHGPLSPAKCWQLDPQAPETRGPTPGSVTRPLILLLASPASSWLVSHTHPLRACLYKTLSEKTFDMDRGQALGKGAGQSPVCTRLAPFIPFSCYCPRLSSSQSHSNLCFFTFLPSPKHPIGKSCPLCP